MFKNITISNLAKGALAVALISQFQFVQAKVVLPSVFSDNMVLQQKTKAAIWGKTDAGKTVTITTGWSGKKYSVVADNGGNWKVKVSTPSYGGPYDITISDGDVTTLKNVLIGEVWVCSGQSNMEMPVNGWGKVNNYEQEVAAANYPQIRLLQVEQIPSNIPQENAKVKNGGWTECNPTYVAEFSSVAYFFAREVYLKTKVPIGLIHSSWGGTIAEAWTDGQSLNKMPEFVAPVAEIAKVEDKDAQKNYNDKLQAWINLIVQKDSGYVQGNPVWQQNNMDVTRWPYMNVPGFLELKLPNFDGVLWYRKKVTVPDGWAGKPIKISLGTIDDNEITWFNGEKVGETQGWNIPRSYTIPGNLVKAGDNIITVRVFDSGSNGGFYGDAKALTLIGDDGQQVSLSGAWQYHIGMDLKTMPQLPVPPNSPNRPTVLYNSMINPFIQYSIRGAIWYQGESNAGRAYQYRELFPTLIKGWREKWNEGNFPFYFVQLANFWKIDDQPSPAEWAELREAQLKTLSLPNTGMAVAVDLGETLNIHPKNKQEVGRRLAQVALAKTYGQHIEYSGPIYQSQKIDGDKITLSFKFSKGLKAANNETLKGFAIAGDDQKFYWADAKIDGDKIIVSSASVSKPVAVRYAWGGNPICNLYNAAGFPASPFRTDEWNGITYNKK
ncbi:sialate O-acetylesterase [Mucilaginibacter pineti]|uniref:Sialate O-acetylesterase n=1 Tax=Mucilaginibacter pineti TaxID=1391627 RepID=A0A1G6X671_9SPHI|nr:sialate O-acetylesterase [Mucilaginibacter pineti]SDD73574.1 sialate O-acetylesterase [Mucilaginibacter pineti]